MVPTGPLGCQSRDPAWTPRRVAPGRVTYGPWVASWRGGDPDWVRGAPSGVRSVIQAIWRPAGGAVSVIESSTDAPGTSAGKVASRGERDFGGEPRYGAWVAPQPAATRMPGGQGAVPVLMRRTATVPPSGRTGGQNGGPLPLTATGGSPAPAGRTGSTRAASGR